MRRMREGWPKPGSAVPRSLAIRARAGDPVEEPRALVTAGRDAIADDGSDRPAAPPIRRGNRAIQESTVANAMAKDQIALMIHRRTALFSGLSLAGLWAISQPAVAQLSSQDSADLARIQAYLNGIRSLRARFIQTAPDGSLTQGVAMMQRPGKMRFQYDPPSPFLLVANYGILFFHDSQLNQTTNIPLSRTPLGILLGDQVALSGAVTVTRFVRLPGQLQVSLVRSDNPGEGTLTLIFADNPLTLRQWIVLDQQGKQTRVSFTNLDVGAAVDAKLFDYRDQAGGGQAGGGG
jgi:outer membrane lipoprotein-sorting protein